MLRWEQFFKNIQQDLKLFLFVVGVFCLFRIGFIIILKSYLSANTTLSEIVFALYYGLRLSLKSAGLITAFSFIFCTLVNLVFTYKQHTKVRLFTGCIYITILSLLFQARIPFYEQFHVVFTPLIFNTFNDDAVALFHTLVQQYNLPIRLLAGFVIAGILCWLLKIFLNTRTYSFPRFSHWYYNWPCRVLVIVIICTFCVFVRFGGSLTSAHSIEWKASAVSRDEFLNEAILDDIQALRRAKIQYELLEKATGLDVRTDRIIEYGRHLSGRTDDSLNLEDYFKKTAKGAKIDKPKHIFLIIGESYANWPLMDKYKNLNIANGMRNIISQENAVYVPSFLPNGPATAMCINGIVTGLADVNLATNYQSESYKEPYATAIAPQLKKLGYKTNFWYGGFTTWERIRDFTLAQGFDEYHGFGDFERKPSNLWGTDDKKFLTAVDATFDDSQPSFNVILTVSNHGPYTVNLAEENFEESTVTAGLPEKLASNKDLVKTLGHFWYSDKYISAFIQNMHQKHPDSLFVFIGDHADRTNLDSTPTLFERYAIPLVLYGKGINKSILPKDVAGDQLNIMPTLIEMIAPKGFEYYSIGESLTNGNKLGINQAMWITPNFIGKVRTNNMQALPWISKSSSKPNIDQIYEDVDTILAVSWWRIKNGKYIN